MTWRDRWSDRSVERPALDSVPGRYALASGPAIMASVPMRAGDRLLPLDGDSWRVDVGEQAVTGRYVAPEAPPELLVDSLLHIAETLGDAPDIERLTKTSPLVPGINRRIRATAFTAQLEDEMHHLLAIARSPHTRLRVSAERRALDRVKRPARRAPLTLATRADDWEAPTLTGVRPRRLLARVIDDDIDFYENRAAARLIDHILRWLTRRLGELRALVGLLEDISNLSDRVHEVGWRRRTRLTALWGEEHANRTALEVARETEGRVAALRRRLQGTLDSTLYRAIPRRTRIGDALRQTNLLVNDQRYRFVARLWRAWLDARIEPTPDPEERHAERQRFAAAFDRFVLLVVARALHSLDVESKPEPRGWRLRWRGQDLDATLSIGADGVVCLTGSARPHWCFVPLPAVLDSAAARTARSLDTLDARSDAQSPYMPRTIAVLIDGIPREKQPPTPPFDPAEAGPSAITVSPLCLESVERIRRAVKWWLHAPRLGRWPLSAELPRRLRAPIVSELDWLAPGQQPDRVRVVHWPAAVAGDRIGGLTATVPAYKRRPDEREHDVASARGALADLSTNAMTLGVCPECGTPNARPERADARAFLFECVSCRAHWGTNTCSDCGKATPASVPSADDSTAALGERCAWCG